ncbi:MAG: ATP-binding protein [Myxococcales bacterium]|nr:ATP-binding protein [Myxococcales bacterium]
MSGDPLAAREQTQWLAQQVARLAAHLAMLAPEVAFLGEVQAEVFDRELTQPEPARIGEELDRRLRTELPPEAPIRRLAEIHHLSALEVDVLLLGLLPELDDRFGALFQELRGGGTVRRPTLGMALRALRDVSIERWEARQALSIGSLLAGPLLVARDLDRPLVDRTIEPRPAIVAALDHRTPEAFGHGLGLEVQVPDLELQRATTLRPALAEQAAGLARWADDTERGLVHVYGGSRAEGRMLARVFAARSDRPLWSVRAPASLANEALLEASVCAQMHDAVVLVEVIDGGTVRLRGDWRSPRPVWLLAGPDLQVEVPSTVDLRRSIAPRPRPSQQRETWRHFLDDVEGDANVNRLSAQTHLGVDTIRRVVLGARDRAHDEVDHGGGPTEEHVRASLEEHRALPIVRGADLLWSRVEWSELVLDERTRRRLEALVRRVSLRVRVQDDWELLDASHRGDGVVALFHGEPGTGKTFAAEAMARELGLPLMAVDLSRVVSKYIGETEKNLAELFEAAEGYAALLSFNEADALFGKRTAVRDAHDRYANLETSFLLHRLETFEGVAVLSTNLLSNLDDAFVRRLAAVVKFPRPDPAARLRLWERKLRTVPFDDDVDLASLAERFDLVGGEIGNAAITAAYAAAARRGRVTQALLVEAARHELTKKGRPSP